MFQEAGAHSFSGSRDLHPIGHGADEKVHAQALRCWAQRCPNSAKSRPRKRALSAANVSGSRDRRAMALRGVAVDILSSRPGFAGNDAVMPLAVRFLGLKRQAQPLAHDPCKKAAD
jgi:hypothetical protein